MVTTSTRSSTREIAPLGRTVRALAIAPLGGLAVLVVATIPKAGFSTPIAALYMAPFCYAAAFVLVLPVLLFLPRTRTPGLVIGAFWGGVVAWAAAVVVSPSYRAWVRWEVALWFGLAGAASGALYAFLVKRRVA